MRKVRHRNVVQFIGACTKRPNLCIVFEFMTGGSVYDHLRQVAPCSHTQGLLLTAMMHAQCSSHLSAGHLHAARTRGCCSHHVQRRAPGCSPPQPRPLALQNGPLKLVAALKVATEVCRGMDYLHKRNIVHRDLKAANLLMDDTGGVKIGDFGVARVMVSAGVMTAETGTYR